MNNQLYYNNLGNDFLEKKNYEKALENYLIAISLEPNEPMFYHNAGVCLISLKHFERAASLFKKAIEKGLKEDETYYYLIICLFNSSNYEKVVLSKIPEKEELKINSLLLIIKSYIKLNNTSKAKLLINELKLSGFNSQELDLIEKMM